MVVRNIKSRNLKQICGTQNFLGQKFLVRLEIVKKKISLQLENLRHRAQKNNWSKNTVKSIKVEEQKKGF